MEAGLHRPPRKLLSCSLCAVSLRHREAKSLSGGGRAVGEQLEKALWPLDSTHGPGARPSLPGAIGHFRRTTVVIGWMSFTPKLNFGTTKKMTCSKERPHQEKVKGSVLPLEVEGGGW